MPIAFTTSTKNERWEGAISVKYLMCVCTAKSDRASIVKVSGNENASRMHEKHTKAQEDDGEDDQACGKITRHK